MYTISHEKLFVTCSGNTVQRVSVFAGNWPNDLNLVSMTQIVGKTDSHYVLLSLPCDTYRYHTNTRTERHKIDAKKFTTIIYHS